MATAAARRTKKEVAVITITLPELSKGEHYAGLVLNQDGTPAHHLILLPGEAESVTWKDALKWAKDLGGDLPSRQEQSLLFANAKQHFQPRYYWSNEQHAAGSDYAWGQSFHGGGQLYWRKDDITRARAVRRLPI